MSKQNIFSKEPRFTAKHLTMFGFFLTYSQSVRAKKKLVPAEVAAEEVAAAAVAGAEVTPRAQPAAEGAQPLARPARISNLRYVAS